MLINSAARFLLGLWILGEASERACPANGSGGEACVSRSSHADGDVEEEEVLAMKTSLLQMKHQHSQAEAQDTTADEGDAPEDVDQAEAPEGKGKFKGKVDGKSKGKGKAMSKGNGVKHGKDGVDDNGTEDEDDWRWRSQDAWGREVEKKVDDIATRMGELETRVAAVEDGSVGITLPVEDVSLGITLPVEDGSVGINKALEDGSVGITLPSSESAAGSSDVQVAMLQEKREELLAKLNGLQTELSSMDVDLEGQDCASFGCHAPYFPWRHCQCNSLCSKFGNCCQDYQQVCNSDVKATSKTDFATCDGKYSFANQSDAPCVCIFDIDRTLTGTQGTKGHCPGNDESNPYVWDAAYGGGHLTWSELGANGLASTFCSRCYTGVVSAGTGSNDEERSYIVDVILKTSKQEELAKKLPSAKAWSNGYIPSRGRAKSPFVATQPDRKKQYAVQAIQQWYDTEARVCIPNFGIHFFGDRTENMDYFADYGYNAREVSCGSRDRHMAGMVGYCGAKLHEIVEAPGVCKCGQCGPPAPEASCDAFSLWPDVDNGVTCGGCKALVQTGPYGGVCDTYCQSFGHTCVAAAEERNEDCTESYPASCSDAISGTSDMLCTCVLGHQ